MKYQKKYRIMKRIAILLIVLLLVIIIKGSTISAGIESDLIIADIYTVPSSPVEGESFSIKFEIENIGNLRNTEIFYSRLYIDDISKKEWYTPANNLIAGETITVSYDVSLSEGLHTIKVVVDVYDYELESNELNNVRSETITVESKEKPDLIITDIYTSPDNPISDEDFKISVNIANIGIGDAKNRFRVVLYINSIYAGEAIVNNLGAGKSQEWTWLRNLNAGEHKIRAEIDADKVIKESSELNNEMSLSISVSPPFPSGNFIILIIASIIVVGVGLNFIKSKEKRFKCETCLRIIREYPCKYCGHNPEIEDGTETEERI